MLTDEAKSAEDVRHCVHNNTKGISLIVLIVTIIIMIILASVIILSLTKNAIIENAKEAVEASDAAIQKNISALAKMDWDLMTNDEKLAWANSNGIVGEPTIREYVKKQMEKQGIDTSSVVIKENGEILEGILKDGVIIPKGFYYVGGTKETGMVISDSRLDKDKGDSDNIASTLKGNQFVWIPVEDISKFKQTTTYDGTITSPGFGFQEPYTSGYITEVDEYNKMQESVKINKGFYIARYEAGKENIGGVNTVVSQKGKTAWTYLPWGDSTSSIGTEGVVYKSKQMYKDSVSIVSTLCYGVQWDAALQFIYKTDSDYPTNSKEKGNYTGNLKNTGYYAVNSIYDMAGNVWDRTMEAHFPDNRVYRGGHCKTSSDEEAIAAFYRGGSNSADSYTTVGFRVAIYIK